MSTFSGRQFKGASRHMKQLKREEAEKRQAEYAERMKKLANVLVVEDGAELQTVLGVVEYQEDAVGLYPVVQVEAPKKRVRARHRKTTTEGK